MKKLLFFLLAAIAVITDARAQGHIQWSTREATPNMQANLFKGMATDRNGNTYTINFTQSSVNFYVTYRFFCYGANGVKKWQYNNDSCFTDCHDYYYAVVPLEIGGAIFVGVYEDLTGTAQVRIKRISANGHLVWQQYWNAPFMAGDIAAARLDQSGKLLIAFHNAFISSQTQENYALAKFDTATGLNTWHVELPDGGTLIQPLSETFTGMATDAGNNIYLTGTAYNPFTGTTINSYVFKMDPAGNLVYKQQTTGVNFAGSSDIHTDPAGNIYLLGMNNAGTGVAVEQRVAANGLFSWNKVLNHDSAFVEPVGFETMGGETYVVFNHHYFIPDSSIFGGGFNTNHHYSMARLAYNGTVRWTRDYLADFDINAVQFDQGGAAQMLACNNNLYVLSGLPLDDTSSYMLLQQIDTAGNSVWYDSTREDFGVGAMTTDDGCNIDRKSVV